MTPTPISRIVLGPLVALVALTTCAAGAAPAAPVPDEPAAATAVRLLASSADARHATGRRATVDEDALVPALSPGFAPWTCRVSRTGPVCRGELHLELDWVPADLPCDVPVWNRQLVDRTQTRYHDDEGLNWFRTFRTTNRDEFSTSPVGPATGSVVTRSRFVETFDVPGDDRTITVTSEGVLWDVRPATGRSLFRVVGTLIEPYDAPPTFSGRVMLHGVTSRHHDVPLSTVLDDERFGALLCEAATG